MSYATRKHGINQNNGVKSINDLYAPKRESLLSRVILLAGSLIALAICAGIGYLVMIVK